MKDSRQHLASVSFLFALIAVALSLTPNPARAFCGFYVATGDMRIYNHASKVVLARDGDRTVITMSSDFRGDPKEFAVVVPVPVVLQKGQVHVGDSMAVTHLDDFSVPRLVEYTDPNPCPIAGAFEVRGDKKLAINKSSSSTRQIVTSADLRILAEYKVDEYDIKILSADEGRALARWLQANGYTIPGGAESVLSSYIKQGMYFFVAKVDVTEQQRLGFTYLRPIQVAFESPKFMLPIRLGMVNSEGSQEMIVLTLTRRGRVETTNYRTVRVPTDIDLPEFVKGEFVQFYPKLFEQQRRKMGKDVVFLEYAWSVSPMQATCDPCTGPNLTPGELRSLGAYWIAREGYSFTNAFLTRLHLRYDAKNWPEDLVLQETGDQASWQARYVIHHPYPGDQECPERKPYLQKVWERRKDEAANYAMLTGVDEGNVRQRMGVHDDWSQGEEGLSWWEKIWSR